MALKIKKRYEIDPTTGCWNWLLALTKKGYAKEFGPSTLAYKNMYQAKHGPVPKGKMLDHTCRNRRCVNPDHLEPVTNTENTRRGSKPVINMAIALEIRRMRAEGSTYKDIADHFDVTVSLVSHVLNGRVWKEDDGNKAISG